MRANSRAAGVRHVTVKAASNETARHIQMLFVRLRLQLHPMDASRVVDERLRKRAAFATSSGHAVCSVLVAVANFPAEPWRTAAILLPSPLFSLLMVCVSPAASDSDLGTPTLERPMLNASISSAVASMGTFFAAARHRWHPIDSLHGLIMSLTHFCVPCLGVCNARWFWPAHRAALTVSGAAAHRAGHCADPRPAPRQDGQH